MLKEKVWEYATWLTVLAATLIMPLVFLAFDGPYVAKYWRDSIGPLAMVMSFFILFVTVALAVLVTVDEEKNIVRHTWAFWVVAYAFVGLFTHLFSGTSLYREISVTWSVYIPGIVFSLNLTAVILIQMWLAVEGLKLSLWVALPVSGLFATWICYALINCGDMRLVAISAVVDVLLLSSLPVLLALDKYLEYAAGKRNSSS